MEEFFVTRAMAEEREKQLLDSGNALGLSETFLNVSDYLPGEKADLDRYINDYGIQFFSINEVVRPHRPNDALRAGYTELIAPIHLWPWVMLVLRIGDLMREEVGRGIKLRNVYRPMSYNKLVAASELESDHPNACSGDFDFKSIDDRRTAEVLIRGLHSNHPQLEISLGMGARTLHVGVMSPMGQRSWFYDSYTDNRMKL